MSVAALSAAWVYGRSLSGIVALNPTGIMNFLMLGLLCVVRRKSLEWADHSTRGVLPSMMCLRVFAESQDTYAHYSSRGMKKNIFLSFDDVARTHTIILIKNIFKENKRKLNVKDAEMFRRNLPYIISYVHYVTKLFTLHNPQTVYCT
jgi:hypothetical protein